MKAMILAAGRGQRMRPLTDTQPKPLLTVHGKALIEWQIEQLVAGGFNQIVINHAWLGAQIEQHLRGGQRFGAQIQYSRETSALESLGGIVQALPLLGRQPFALVSGDIFSAYPYARLAEPVDLIAQHYPHQVAHLVLTDNPAFHPQGDMALIEGLISLQGEQLTYANIGVFHPSLFAGLAPGQVLKLFPWAYQFVEQQKITGEYFSGFWENVGTPEQLARLNQIATSKLSNYNVY